MLVCWTFFWISDYLPGNMNAELLVRFTEKHNRRIFMESSQRIRSLMKCHELILKTQLSWNREKCSITKSFLSRFIPKSNQYLFMSTPNCIRSLIKSRALVLMKEYAQCFCHIHIHRQLLSKNSKIVCRTFLNVKISRILEVEIFPEFDSFFLKRQKKIKKG